MPQWNAAVLDPKSPAHKEPVATDAETMEVSVTDNHKVTGVLRDKSFGEPIGTWSVSESMAKTMRLLSEVADSKNDPDGPSEAWAAASKRKVVTLEPVEVGTSDEPRSSKILKVITPSKSSKRDREDTDFAALDDLFLDSGKKKSQWLVFQCSLDRSWRESQRVALQRDCGIGCEATAARCSELRCDRLELEDSQRPAGGSCS